MRMPGRPSLSAPGLAAALVAGALLALAAWAAPGVFGHDLLSRYVRHDLEVRADSTNIDFHLTLTFHETLSAFVRKRIDSDSDGRISGAEAREYERQMAVRLPGIVGLKLEGKPIELIPLYAPELDLMDEPRASGGRHQLKLHFFARTPGHWGQGHVLEFVDGLWLDAPYIQSGSSAAVETSRPVEFLDEAKPVSALVRSGAPIVFRLRCLKEGE